jgi:hypothetical protein
MISNSEGTSIRSWTEVSYKQGFKLSAEGRRDVTFMRKRSIVLGPAAQLNRESDCQLRKLQHMGEAKLIRYIVTTANCS